MSRNFVLCIVGVTIFASLAHAAIESSLPERNTATEARIEAPRADTSVPEPMVRVRTNQRVSQIVISGFGLKVNGEKAVEAMITKKTRLKVSYHGGSWLIGAPLNLKIAGEKLVIEGDFLQVGGQPSADRLILTSIHKSRFDVISELTLDDYLKGVLPSEMPVAWPLETLKAQVVASRSYALNQIHAHAGDSFHLDDSVLHQVFNWANYLNAVPADQSRIIQAINDTRGEVLHDAQGEAYLAYFHADCGGHTEEPTAVWGSGAKNGTVRDMHCALNTHSAWQEEVSRDEFDQTLAKHFGLEEGSHLSALQVVSHSPTGRVQNLAAIFDSQKHILTAQTLRQLVGFSRIKSTNFQFRLLASGVLFSGRGNGHGVGLCQQGARFMGMGGADHYAILHRYYPKALL